MKRFHVHVAVHDLQQSIRFYSALFGAEPAVKKDASITSDCRPRTPRSWKRHRLAPCPGRRLDAGAERRVVLLREERQVLDGRSAGRGVGVVPYARQHPHVRRRQPRQGHRGENSGRVLPQVNVVPAIAPASERDPPTTAQEYFGWLGFTPVGRDAVPGG